MDISLCCYRIQGKVRTQPFLIDKISFHSQKNSNNLNHASNLTPFQQADQTWGEKIDGWEVGKVTDIKLL